MAIRGVDFKWYDGFFLSMLATSVIIVSINWKRYRLCTYPLHIWIVVDYTTVFVFRLLMFVDNGLAAGMGLDGTDLMPFELFGDSSTITEVTLSSKTSRLPPLVEQVCVLPRVFKFMCNR